MKNYSVTEEMRNGVNNYLGFDYIKAHEIGHEIDHLANYESISNIVPEKAKVLMATLFPEQFGDIAFVNTHKAEIINLAQNLHVEKKAPAPKFSWTDYMVRREYLPPVLEGKTDEDILSGNIVRFK